MTSENDLQKKKMFNPYGNDLVSKRTIIKGDTTNLFNLNNVKYKWASNLYRIMVANFWIPEKVDLSNDIEDYKNLTEDEKKSFDGIISFLIFLDSIQTNNLPNISDYITAPEVSTILAVQTYQEAIHSQSYAYILESIVPIEKKEKIYEFWREDKVLLERNKYIAKIYDDLTETPNDKNFVKAVLANYILEGIYFYNGFNFFYNLASRNKLLGVADEIRYINKDELTHVVLFQSMIKEIKNEFPELITKELVHEMFEEAVKQEITWTEHIIGERILGITNLTTEKYTKYLANLRLKAIGFDILYQGYEENPYKYLEAVADLDGENMKGAFFESTITNYSQSSMIDGWDEI